MGKGVLSSLVAFAAIVMLSAGCGSGNKGSTGPTTISAQQSVAAAEEVEQTLIAAVDASTTDFCPKPTQIGQYDACTVGVASTPTCSAGGTASYTGSLTGLVDFTDTGNFTGTLTFTPADCAIPNSSLVMSGSASLQLNSQIFYFYGGAQNVTVSATGPINYGPTPSGVCQANLTITAQIEGNAQRSILSCTITGTACGQTINQNCM